MNGLESTSGRDLKTPGGRPRRSCISPSTTGISPTSRKLTDQDATDRRSDTEAVTKGLRRYRLLAYAVGVLLIILVFVGVPLQYGAGIPGVAEAVGPIHGALYLVYLIAAADLVRRSGLRTRRLLIVALAGLVPFLTFVVERRISAEVTARRT
jgi:integral membrane protein